MKKVFTAAHSLEAHFVRGLLEAEGIQAEVRGEAMWVTLASAPLNEALPSVWILNDSDTDRAFPLIARYEGRQGPTGADPQNWRCPGCDEEIEGPFTACWHCGKLRPRAS